MPKRIVINFMILISLGLLLMVLGCGSGDGMAAPRTEDALGELFSGGTGTSNNNNGGGGGGATGACVTSFGCYNGFDQTTCSAAEGTLSAGQNCQNLGYLNCITQGGYTYCY